MLTSSQDHHGLLDRAFNPSAFFQALTLPLIAVTMLLMSGRIYDIAFDRPYWLAAAFAFLLMLSGRYSEAPARLQDVAAEITTQWLAVMGTLLALGWITQTLDNFDRRVMLLWLVATPLTLTITQFVQPRLLSLVMAADTRQRTAIIAGGGALAQQLASRIARSPQMGIRVAGCFEDRAASRVGSQTENHILGGLNDLAGYANRHHIDLIYITLPIVSQPRVVHLLDQLRDTTASIYMVPDIFLFDLIQGRMDNIAGLPVLAVCESPFSGADGVLKRFSDLVIASFILCLISPLMLAIALAIKAGSPGPVIFKQRRYGLDGREIIVYKFRTMSVCEDGNEIRQATKTDSRITPLGRFLRASSLDELPQFINVLQGRMSVVGPRPHAVAHNEMYRKLINGYMIRHKVRPGITGWAQVNGQRGETDTVEKMQARIDYDLDYLRNWSLSLDLRIILKTVLVVLQRQNAY